MYQSISKLAILVLFFITHAIGLLAQDVLIDDGQIHELIHKKHDLTIPLAPNYRAIRFKLRGGDGGHAVIDDCSSKGGDGAVTEITVLIGNASSQLVPGTKIRVITGRRGSYFTGSSSSGFGNNSGHGGGGTAVLAKINGTWEILAVAGGGGGAFQGLSFGACVNSQKGQGGRTSTSGGKGSGTYGGDGGTNGQGGKGGGDSTFGLEDLSAGGGGAFSDGTGDDVGGGRKGYSEGGKGGHHTSSTATHPSLGWGFGGGGSSDNGGGGGGGYSGGGGGSGKNNGGGGGSYVNSTYAFTSSITAGGNDSGWDDGKIEYQFHEDNICFAEISEVDIIHPICFSGDKARIDVDFTSSSGNVCLSEFTIELRPDNGQNSPGNGIFSFVPEGSYDIELIHSSGFLFETQPLNLALDTEPPIANCKNVTVQLVNGTYSNPNFPYLINDNSSDQCNITLSASTTDFSCSNIGTTLVILTVTDQEGNSAECGATVTVKNSTSNGSVAACKPTQTFQLTGNQLMLSPDDIDNGSVLGDCATEIQVQPNSFSCEDIGVHTVTLTVLDRTDNPPTCTTTVTLQDTETPIPQCKNSSNIPPVELDQNGTATIDYTLVDDGSFDHCTALSYDISPNTFDCIDVGIVDVTLTVTDSYGNSSNCITSISVEDNIAPAAVCQDITIALDENGYQTIVAEELDNGSADICNVDFAAAQTSFDCEDLGDVPVVLTVTDDHGNQNTCIATVTVEDHLAPTISCQDVTLELSVSGFASISSTSLLGNQPTDNCMITNFQVLGSTFFSCEDVGAQTLVLQATDNSGLIATCISTITVEDHIAPTPICLNPTITFNGEASINLETAVLWDEMASSDNCSEIFFVDQSVWQVTCDQLNTTIPVEVTIEDANGNEAICTSNVFVSGLPCGWNVDPNGLGCDPTGVANYDPASATFELGSEGCYDPSYYRSSDPHGFIQTEYCGDGQITAYISEVTGNGWAGISMRESNDPSAAMIQLMIDGVSISRRELRQTYGSYAFAHLYPTQEKNWLRLSRSGNQFTASRSADGVTWEHVFITQIPMSNCIEIGMVTMNGSPTGQVTGVYENVSVNGTSALVAPATIDIAQETVSNLDFNIFPNPATDEVNLQLDQFLGKEVILRIYNHYGQTVLQKPLGEVQYTTERLNLGRFGQGTYLIELQAGSERVTKKVVLISM